MTETLEQRLIRHEGVELMPYTDTRGFRTVGCGHRITPEDGDRFDGGISYDAAMALLQDDITKARMAVARALPWTYDLDDVREDVLVEMAFQLGIAGLLEFKLMLADIRAGDWAKAAEEMRNSKWHAQTPSRCEELAKIMKTGAAP